MLDGLREVIDEQTLSTMQISANCYAPDNFDDFYRWREVGVNSVQMDLEVMDPAYFAAICPNKNEAHPQEYWRAGRGGTGWDGLRQSAQKTSFWCATTASCRRCIDTAASCRSDWPFERSAP